MNHRPRPSRSTGPGHELRRARRRPRGRPHRGPRWRLLFTFGIVLMLLAGCGSLGGGREGTAIPDGDEAAQYVSDKFATTLQQLSDGLPEDEAFQSTIRSYTRVDEERSDMTITSTQVGNPPSRLWKNHSNRDSGDYRDFYHPAGSDVEYTRLGPVYSELAPTEWVAMPYEGDSYDICMWGGYATVCRMLSAISSSMDSGNAAKQAKSHADGSLRLTAEITLDTFLEQRVVILPDWILDKITPTMRERTIDTTLTLDGAGNLTGMRMQGTIAADGHEFEVDNHYRLEEAPTEDQLPPEPNPDNVTPLRTDQQRAEHFRRMDEITSAEN